MARRIARMVVEGKLAQNGQFAITAQNLKSLLPI
jgi:hypothetical protein